MEVYVPLKIQLSLDDQMMMVENAADYSQCTKKVLDIEKGNSETPRYASFLCKFKKQFSVDMADKYMQLLMNHNLILPKFSTRDKTAAEKVLEPPRMRKYKCIGSLNSRKVAFLFSALSCFGTIILIFLTLREQISDASSHSA